MDHDDATDHENGVGHGEYQFDELPSFSPYRSYGANGNGSGSYRLPSSGTRSMYCAILGVSIMILALPYTASIPFADQDAMLI